MLVLAAFGIGGFLLYRRAQAAQAQSRADAIAALRKVLHPKLELGPPESMVPLVTRGGYADTFEVESREAKAIRALVGTPPVDIVRVEERGGFHGIDLHVDLVRADGARERWRFVFAFRDLPLARIVQLRSAERLK